MSTKEFYTSIRIVIADDHELLRDGFKVMVSRIPEIDLVGEASNGEELLKITAELMPDVVVTDIVMPRMDGIEATKKLTLQFPHIGIIAFSMFDDENLIVDMLEAGAKGYLVKNAHKSEILEAIKTVYRQHSYYCNHTHMKLAKMIATSTFNPYRKIKKTLFSEREIEVIRLIAEGLASKEIAQKLNLKQRTIERYRDLIMEKMDASNSAGLVVYAIKNGLIKI